MHSMCSNSSKLINKRQNISYYEYIHWWVYFYRPLQWRIFIIVSCLHAALINNLIHCTISVKSCHWQDLTDIVQLIRLLLRGACRQISTFQYRPLKVTSSYNLIIISISRTCSLRWFVYKCKFMRISKFWGYALSTIILVNVGESNRSQRSNKDWQVYACSPNLEMYEYHWTSAELMNVKVMQ